MRRRGLLRRGAVLAALGLAGCAGAPTDTPTPAEPGGTPTTSPEPEAASATASPTGSPTSMASDTRPTDSPTSSPTPTATAEPTETPTPTTTATPTATPTPTVTPTPDQEVVVAPGGSLSFEPASFQIAVGDTVRWTWDAGGHNVKPSATPAGSDWSGTPGGEYHTFDAGYTYRHTFDVAGTYGYYCAPHRSAGMTGSFTVG